jgi:NADH-quinone oxidoreductase subunit C
MNTISLIAAVTDHSPNSVVSSHSYRGDATVVLKPESLIEVSRFLKKDADLLMDLLMDLSAVDYSTYGKGPSRAFFDSSGSKVRPRANMRDEDPWPGPVPGIRFAVVYHFYSVKHRHRLRVVVALQDSDLEVDSLTELWAGANWLEREVWDMFGIRFRGHPDLKRILMYEEFEGHPLRKDYPVNRRQPLIGPVN